MNDKEKENLYRCIEQFVANNDIKGATLRLGTILIEAVTIIDELDSTRTHQITDRISVLGEVGKSKDFVLTDMDIAREAAKEMSVVQPWRNTWGVLWQELQPFILTAIEKARRLPTVKNT